MDAVDFYWRCDCLDSESLDGAAGAIDDWVGSDSAGNTVLLSLAEDHTSLELIQKIS